MPALLLGVVEGALGKIATQDYRILKIKVNLEIIYHIAHLYHIPSDAPDCHFAGSQW